MSLASRLSMPSARNLVVILILLATISPFAVFAVPELTGADEGYVVLSGSMEPALSPGDVVIVDASVPISVGDIITYRTGDTVPTTHRVVGERDGGYETKGDANDNVDAGLVVPDAIVGRVVITIPLVGHVILWANTPVGYVSLVVVPLMLLGVSELVAWARRESGASADESADSTRTVSDAESPADGNVEAAVPVIPAGVEGSGSSPADDGSDSDLTPDSNALPSADTVLLAVVDLKLTLLAMGVLFAYAGWNVYREFTITAAPTPLSVGALTAGLLGLLFAGWVTVAAWRADCVAEPAHSPALPVPDGGEASEDNDE
ncbi:signal peptidase I [Halorubrum sp. BOL3-1]|uniref:signal peptidase I n=1 Tax=Halorubrum sp. BOL3-1 TaxID=2497325 RepID=UPI00100520C1|nr:signal peptidase I [Halorubrum sp. BOL3-1]QAU14036.1 signal peptidase I [Halorubrum sp. BOL3-1]